ncbi:uncharacterized protein LOC131886288 [Tigriopus californicus]|uniref:uncharacterized protein LOC131886288 n=1 Tax=Tigriopus californicus TaxID=6832 RepID=UPI0027DA2A2B|nr:uncharacterized protein LOC131886288 [Tigriopus californicus]
MHGYPRAARLPIELKPGTPMAGWRLVLSALCLLGCYSLASASHAPNSTTTRPVGCCPGPCSTLMPEHRPPSEAERNISGDWRRVEAELMRHAVGNISSWWSRAHFRATHSHQAQGASWAVSLLLCSLAVGVVASGMWAERGRWAAVMGQQPLFFETHAVHAQQWVPDAIRSHARSLVRLGRRERRIHFPDEMPPDAVDSTGSLTKRQAPLDMSLFLRNHEPTDLDRAHQHFLMSSDEDEPSELDYVPSSSDDSDLDYSVFSYNRRHGEWQGSALSVGAPKGSWIRSIQSSVQVWRRGFSQPPKKSVNADSVQIRLLPSSSSSDSELNI